MSAPTRDSTRRAYEVTLDTGGAFIGVRPLLTTVRSVLLALTFVSGLFANPLISVVAACTTFFLWVVLSVATFAGRTLSSKTRATLTVESDALVIRKAPDRERRVPLATLRSGRVLPDRTTGGGARVLLQGRLGSGILAHFHGVDVARSFLRELRMSARDRPASFSFFFGLRVTVGADGVLMAWPLLRRRRFVPYSTIVSMKHFPGTILFHLADGRRYEIMTTTSKRSTILEQHDALVERIDDACAAYRAENVGAPLAALERGGRSALGWVKDMRALSEANGSGYRAAMLPSDALWVVAQDPAAPEEMRIGAGLALRSALDPEGRALLRAAAEASASPRVRVALEAAADGLDDEQVGDAIAEAGAITEAVRPLCGRPFHSRPERATSPSHRSRKAANDRRPAS